MRKNAWLKKTLIALGAIIIIIAVVSTYKLNSSIKNIGMNTENIIIPQDKREEIEQQDTKNKEIVEQIETKPEDFYMLLIGLDIRGDTFTLNTDSIIVSHVIPQHNAMKLLSLPRDLKVENLRQKEVKVNSVFAEGYNYAVAEARKDPSLLSGKRVKVGDYNLHEAYITSGSVVLRETVERYLDIDIEHTFIINFQTVISLVDAIGGIEIDVDRSMQYDDPTDNTHIHLEKGLQVLNGEDALNYSRFRQDNRGEEYWSSDFKRGIRQQQVIIALANELSSWSNITKVINLLDIISKNFKTDMGTSEMLSLIRKFHGNLDKDSIISVPFEAYWDGRQGYSLIEPDKLEQVKEEFKSIDLPVVEEENPES